MALSFDWNALKNKDIVQRIRHKINESINSNENADVVGSMHITEINFGSQPPELEITEFHDITTNKIKTAFSFYYEGDASITFYTRVELNPLVSTMKTIGSQAREEMGVLNSHLSLTAPIYITLSHFQLEGKVVLSYEQPYLFISLKNEALKKVKVNSSFDGCSASSAVARAVHQNLIKAFKTLTTKPVQVRL